MMGGADKMTGYNTWLTRLKSSFSIPNLLSVASSSFLHLNSNLQLIAKVNSVAKYHYLKLEHRKTMTAITNLKNGPKAMLPNNVTIQTTCRGHLPFPNLSKKASTALVYPYLTNESLISI